MSKFNTIYCSSVSYKIISNDALILDSLFLCLAKNVFTLTYFLDLSIINLFMMSKRILDSVPNSNEFQSCHQLSTHVEIFSGLSWARQFSCFKCFEFWIICIVCQKNARLNTSKIIRQHDIQCHSIYEDSIILSYDNLNDTDGGFL